MRQLGAILAILALMFGTRMAQAMHMPKSWVRIVSLPMEVSLRNGLWRFDDLERNVTCYIVNNNYEALSCVANTNIGAKPYD
jgi:hypothetical protein